MTASIFVGYATTAGSTKEVAEAIAGRLRECGLSADCASVRETSGLAGYSAVVLGAPLYIMRWHADMHRFLKKQRGALVSLPAAVFALGPWNDKAEELQSACEQLDKELLKHAWLKPVALQVFVGKFDPQKLAFPFNLVGSLKKMPAQDDRDWEAIGAWADSLPALLQRTVY